MLRLAGTLALLAAAVTVLPRPYPSIRLDRAIAGGDESAAASADSGGRRHWPGWPRSWWRRGLLTGGAVVALAQFWPLPVAAAALAAGATASRSLVRARRDRAVVRTEQAGVEGLGVLVAELRAGRTPGDALEAAGRHCGDPEVGAQLSRLGRSLLLGDSLAGWHDTEEPTGSDVRTGSDMRKGSRNLPRRSPPRRIDPTTWQVRLIDGVRLSQQTGCGLADVLAAVESDLVRRGRQRTELRAAAAGHRATVALLAALPILGLAMGSGIGAEPVRILTTTTIGQVLLVAGVTLELFGLAWSRRLTGRALRAG